MLHISDQMIRYYERNGIIHPSRSKDGNYRLYSMEDVFFLFEAIRYKEWNINIGEISDLISENYIDSLINRLQVVNDELQQELAAKAMLQKRIAEIHRTLRVCKYNIGKYWITEKREARYYYSGMSNGDHYERPVLDDMMAQQIFDAGNISYFDVCVEFCNDNLIWWYKINEDYYQRLHIVDYGEVKRTPTQLCLSTYINMGEMGEFSGRVMDDVYTYMERYHYTLDGVPRGVIIGRGNEEKGTLCRIMELEIPICIPATL